MFVDFENRALDAAVFIRGLEPFGKLTTEHIQTLLPFHADDRIHAAGHTDIGDVTGAAGQNPDVGGGHVGMGAPDGGCPAVEVPAHGLLF